MTEAQNAGNKWWEGRLTNQKVVFQTKLGLGRKPEELLVVTSTRKPSQIPPAAFPMTTLILCCDFIHVPVESSNGIFSSLPTACLALGRASRKDTCWMNRDSLFRSLARGYPSV